MMWLLVCLSSECCGTSDCIVQLYRLKSSITRAKQASFWFVDFVSRFTLAGLWAVSRQHIRNTCLLRSLWEHLNPFTPKNCLLLKLTSLKTYAYLEPVMCSTTAYIDLPNLHDRLSIVKKQDKGNTHVRPLTYQLRESIMDVPEISIIASVCDSSLATVTVHFSAWARLILITDMESATNITLLVTLG